MVGKIEIGATELEQLVKQHVKSIVPSLDREATVCFVDKGGLIIEPLFCRVEFFSPLSPPGAGVFRGEPRKDI